MVRVLATFTDRPLLNARCPLSFTSNCVRDRRDGAKARKLLAAELAALLGRQLVLAPPPPPPPQAAAAAGQEAAAQAAAAAVGAGAAAGPAVRWAALHRPAADLDFLSLMASAALEASPALQLLLLTTDDSEPGALPAPAPKPGVEDRCACAALLWPRRNYLSRWHTLRHPCAMNCPGVRERAQGNHSAKTVYAMQQSDSLRMSPEVTSLCVCVPTAVSS